MRATGASPPAKPPHSLSRPRGRLGFLRNPEPGSTASAFFRDGWFYPGDVGEMNEEGYLFLRGRAKDMIIRGGANIYPSDVELVLQTHPAVEERRWSAGRRRNMARRSPPS